MKKLVKAYMSNSIVKKVREVPEGEHTFRPGLTESFKIMSQEGQVVIVRECLSPGPRGAVENHRTQVTIDTQRDEGINRVAAIGYVDVVDGVTLHEYRGGIDELTVGELRMASHGLNEFLLVQQAKTADVFSF